MQRRILLSQDRIVSFHRNFTILDTCGIAESRIELASLILCEDIPVDHQLII